MKTVLLKSCFFFIFSLALTVHAKDDLPRSLVETTSTTMAERLIADKEMVQTQDYYLEQLVDEVIIPIVDHRRMAKRVLGKHWKRASKDQQSSFSASFKHKVIRTYAGAFKAFNGEEIRYEPSRFNDKGNQALVKSQIIRPGASSIRVDYKLYFKKEQWRVFDVIIEGVSLTKSFRDQVSLSIEEQGLAKTISKLAAEYKDEAPVVRLGAHAWGPYLGKTLPNHGLAADIVSSAFAQSGYKTVIEFMPWNRVGDSMKNGELEGSLASWYSADRKQHVAFSDAYIENRLVFVKRDNDPFEFTSAEQSKHELKNKSYRLGVFEDYSYGKEFDKISPLFQVETRNYCSQLFRDVASKELDLALVDHWIAQQELNDKEHIADHLTQVSGVLATRTLHVTISKNINDSEKLINAFNLGLQRLKENGDYDKLLKKHQFPE